VSHEKYEKPQKGKVLATLGWGLWPGAIRRSSGDLRVSGACVFRAGVVVSAGWWCLGCVCWWLGGRFP